MVGAGRFERPTPCAQGSEIGSRRSIGFREFLMVTTIRGNLLSLNEQVLRMERIGFGHSFGTVEKAGRHGRRSTAFALGDKVACALALVSNEFDGSSKEVA